MGHTTNKDLTKWFREFNDRFFDGRLDKRVKVRFALSEDDIDELGDDCDGSYIIDTRTILIDKMFRRLGRMTQIVLLHEMIHAEFPEHISQRDTEAHGLVFHHRMVDLFQRGAYDSLL